MQSSASPFPDELQSLINGIEKKRRFVSSIRDSKTGRLHRDILRTFSRGELPSGQGLVESTGWRSDSVEDHLNRLDQADIIKLAGLGIESAYPFSALPTRHQVELGGSQLFALCAVDALGIPSMLNADALIHSICPHCNKSIAVEVEGETPRNEMGETVVWIPTQRTSGKVADDLCPHIDFICSPRNAKQWAEEVGFDGVSLSLQEALRLGRFAFGNFLRDASSPA